jgi:hypothetical protein
VLPHAVPQVTLLKPPNEVYAHFISVTFSNDGALLVGHWLPAALFIPSLVIKSYVSCIASADTQAPPSTSLMASFSACVLSAGFLLAAASNAASFANAFSLSVLVLDFYFAA